jgi:hypothetical protein
MVGSNQARLRHSWAEPADFTLRTLRVHLAGAFAKLAGSTVGDKTPTGDG